MAQATVKIDLDRSIGVRDPMIYGHFLEHFHRQVYGGVFDPTSPFADAHGFRQDVVEALRRIRVPIIRWPGGCFVSAYHWQDGVGTRTARFDKAWRVEEPNTFGTDEFIAFCRAVGAEPYICTNAGSGTAEEMSDWVEYCNLRDMGPWARLRRENGHAEPHGVRYWSVGNENYGDWEVGAKEAHEWARYVAEAAKMMRRVDGNIQLSAASTADLPWNVELLQAAGRYLDWVSIHGYWAHSETPYDVCMARSGDPERQIARMEHILGALDLLGRIRIAFDEWNLRFWHHPSFLDADPNIVERDKNDENSTYTMADALFSARFLNTCLRHCRTVGMATFSPVVNARGAIYTHRGGIVLRSTYHVFDLYANDMLPEVLDAHVETPTFSVAEGQGPAACVPYLDAVATLDRETGALSLALVNLHAGEALTCTVDLGAERTGRGIVKRLSGASPDSFNDVDHPDAVHIVAEPVALSGRLLELVLPPRSLSVLSVPGSPVASAATS